MVDSALGLAETGNLLMLDAHAQARQDWIRFSNDMIDAAVLASNAALTRDFNAILDAGGVVGKPVWLSRTIHPRRIEGIGGGNTLR